MDWPGRANFGARSVGPAPPQPHPSFSFFFFSDPLCHIKIPPFKQWCAFSWHWCRGPGWCGLPRGIPSSTVQPLGEYQCAMSSDACGWIITNKVIAHLVVVLGLEEEEIKRGEKIKEGHFYSYSIYSAKQCPFCVYDVGAYFPTNFLLGLCGVYRDRERIVSCIQSFKRLCRHMSGIRVVPNVFRTYFVSFCPPLCTCDAHKQNFVFLFLFFFIIFSHSASCHSSSFLSNDVPDVIVSWDSASEI